MIQFGIDIILQKPPLWKNKRLALVTNHAATTNTLQPSRQALLAKEFNVIKLFSPEHGLDIKGADGAKMYDGIDSLTQLPVISLYSHKLQPTYEDLNDIDIVLFDIPDIGCRFYTYLWTLTYILEACATHKKPLIILDRPNPLSGNIEHAEGPMLDEKHCSSFIGRWDIPLKHSCTLGELALYFNISRQINTDIEVIKCQHWQRNDFQPQWEIDFVPTSPAMQTFDSALLYPGLGLLEATNISEGRGTDFPFTIIGAPWLNNNLLIEKLSNAMLTAEPVDFVPTESKYEGQLCKGIQLNVTDKSNFQSVSNGLLIIKWIKDLHPAYFEWKPYPTNVNPTGKQHLDKLLGIDNSEEIFNLSLNEFIAKMQILTHIPHWKQNVQPFLLYA